MLKPRYSNQFKKDYKLALKHAKTCPLAKVPPVI